MPNVLAGFLLYPLKSRLILLITAATVVLVPARAYAQNATLSGLVIDPSGAVVPNAEIVLLSEETAAIRRTASNREGVYVFSFTQPGSYTLIATAQGFRQFEQTQVRVEPAQATAIDIRLEVGTQSDTVTVRGNAGAINTVDATKGQAFDTRAILQLPLEGRNVAGLLSLQTGVTGISDDPESRDIRNGSVNGAQADQTTVTLDGVDVNDEDTTLPFATALRTTLDSVEEFRVVTTNANADQGRSSGAQISLVTRSGTNAFHGALYEFHRNSATAANDFFNNRAGVEQPKLIRNVFGGSAGGPLKRNRAFFFFNYEGRRDASESTELRDVPTGALRNGTIRYLTDDGGVGEVGLDYLRSVDPLGIGANAGVLAYLRQYPFPNDDSGGDGVNTSGYRFTAATPLSWNTSIFRLDWNPGGRGAHQVFVRGNLQRDEEQDAPQFPGQPPDTVRRGRSAGFAVGHTAALTTNLLSSFRYGVTRFDSRSTGVQTESRADQYLGGDTLTGLTRSLATTLPVHSLSEDLSFVRGAHSMQFGGVFRSIRNRRSSNDNSFHEVWADSSFLIGGGDLIVPDLSELYVGPFSSSVVSMLGVQNVGVGHYNYDIDGTLLPEGASVNRTFGVEEYELYAQDSWRATAGLTITAGLRWSLMPPVREVNGAQVAILPSYQEFVNRRIALADDGQPSRDAGLISYVARDAADGQPLYPFHKTNFAPRLAVAYSPQSSDGWIARLSGGPGRMAIRAGAGLFYDRYGMEIMEQLDRHAFGLSSTVQSPPLAYDLETAPRYIDPTTIPLSVVPAAPPGGPGTPPENFGDFQVVDSNLRAPYSINLSASISRELGRDFSMEVGYVGRLGRRTLVTENSGATQANFHDPASGQRLFDALRELETQVRSNTATASIRPIAFWENVYSGAATSDMTATQAVYEVVRRYSPDPTSALYDLDIACNPVCSDLGAYTFFTPQFWRFEAVRSLGSTDYHSLQLNLRKRFSRGFQFDLNYTLAKSTDLVSVWGGYQTGIEGYSNWSITNPWDPESQRGPSDFDLRHQINTNWVAELPFGRGARFLNGPVADALLGGWQISGVWRMTSGLPISVLNVRGWPNGWCCAHYGEPIGEIPEQTNTTDAPLIGGGRGPNVFDDPAAALAAFAPANVGPVGPRNNLRGDGLFTIDLGLSKRIPLPLEGHSLQFRAEAFNLTNAVRFKPDLFGTTALESPGTFGQYTTTLTPARVLQFGLRYEF
jgi:hypothetical protein